MDFKAVARNPVYLQVSEQIREAILAGALPPGEPLPSERELAESFGVSRTSVREGLRALEAQGLISSGRGPASRPSVASDVGAPARDALVNLLRLNRIRLGDLVAVRCALESAGLRAAARDPVERGMDEAREALVDMHGGDVEVEAFHEADVRFHLGLASASGNEAIHLLMLALRETMLRYLLDTLRNAPDRAAAQARLALEHAAILAAVEGGDGERAAELGAEHVQSFYEQGITPSSGLSPKVA